MHLEDTDLCSLDQFGEGFLQEFCLIELLIIQTLIFSSWLLILQNNDFLALCSQI